MKRLVSLLTPTLHNYTRIILLSPPTLYPYKPIPTLTIHFFRLNFFSSKSKSFEKPNFVDTQKSNPLPNDDNIINQNQEFRKIIESLKLGNKEARKEMHDNIFEEEFDYDELFEDLCEKTHRDYCDNMKDECGSDADEEDL